MLDQVLGCINHFGLVQIDNECTIVLMKRVLFLVKIALVLVIIHHLSLFQLVLGHVLAGWVR